MVGQWNLYEQGDKMQPALCGGKDASYEEDASHYDQGGWQVNRLGLGFATIFLADSQDPIQ